MKVVHRIMKIDDLKLGEPLFAILPIPKTNQFVVVYPDRTYDVLGKADVKSDYDAIIALRDGGYESLEDLREGIIDAVKPSSDEDHDDDEDDIVLVDDDDDDDIGGRGDFFNATYKPAIRANSKSGSFDVNTKE